MQITLKVKKLHPAAKLPHKGTIGSAAYDFFCVADDSFIEDFQGKFKILNPGEKHKFHTGIACEIEPGYCILMWDKSGLSCDCDIIKRGGCFDSDYRGEFLITLKHDGSFCDSPIIIREGQKIIQGLVLPVPLVDIIEVNGLSETDRGVGGFGSTGNGLNYSESQQQIPYYSV